jgi:hypothetical protein
MAQTLPDIALFATWTNLNSASGIAVGTKFDIYKKGAPSVQLIESTTEPPYEDTRGRFINDNFPVATIPAGSLAIWARKMNNGDSTVNVQVLT